MPPAVVLLCFQLPRRLCVIGYFGIDQRKDGLWLFNLRQVPRLLDKGLIVRRPGRGRQIAHHLTPTGSTTIAAGHPIANEVLSASFADLSEADRATLLELLLRIVAGTPPRV